MQLRIVWLFLLILAGCVSGVEAQSTEAFLDAHRYTEAIAQLRDGGSSGASAASLGSAHLQRGYALRDLARVQMELGTAYYTKRDTNKAARSGPITSYYAARHRMVTAPATGGKDALAKLVRGNTLPSAVRARARVWVGWGQYRNGNEAVAEETWSRASATSDPAVATDLALARWRAGKALPALNCGSHGSGIATVRCRLWMAIRAENWERTSSLQEKLIQKKRPAERTKTFRVGDDGSYEVSFYDPGTTWALAVADFRAAAAAYQQASQDQAPLLAGLAALEGRDYETARSTLETVGSAPYRPVYRAVLGEETGTPDPQALWKNGRKANNAQVRAVWAQEASQYDAYRDRVRSYCERQDAPESMRRALRLGRAALNVGLPETAYQLMNAAYPVSQNNDLQAIAPAYLASFALAKFRVGPQYESEVLRHLNAIGAEYPIASIAYDLAQGYYVPERTDGLTR